MYNLKNMDDKELKNTAALLREQIIKTVSSNGGHLSSNLGVVELTMAIHKYFDLPNDTLIFDVSHQTYTHKLLTPRNKSFDTLRKYQGISGFSEPKESVYDSYSVGHSSTALSLAIGEAIRNQKLGIKKEIIVVIGDASASSGLTLEALNYIGAHPELKIIIIINDNEMSISQNVGSVARTFNKIRIKRDKAFIYKITPRCMHGFFDKLKNSLKGAIYKKNLFDSFNIKYFPGINGHDFNELAKYLKFAKKYDKSIILHVKTIKGYGYKFAEEDKDGKWHHVSGFDIETGTIHSKEELSVGVALTNSLIEHQKNNNNLVLLTAAMALGNGIEEFQKKYPNDFIDVGIAEDNCVTIASAIASNEIVPIVFIYSTFLQRAYDQILHDVTRCNKHVVFCIDRCGIVSDDGSTHQGIFDLSFLLPLPNMVVLAPSSIELAKECLDYAISYDGPIAIRYPKNLPCDDSKHFVVGKWFIEKEISKINIITYGIDVLGIKEYLKEFDVGLINAISINIFDENILDLISDTKIIVYEQVNGVCSLKDLIVNYYINKQKNVNIVGINLKDTYLESGSVEELKELGKITYQEIINEIR